MDFADIDLRAASERGSWVQLSLRGKLLDARLRILGMGEQRVMDAFHKVERIETLRRQRLDRTSDSQADAVLAKSQADLKAAMAELIVAAVAEWENVSYAGKPLDCTPENVLKICGPGTLMFGQVTDAIQEEQRLFTSADSA